MKHLNPNKKIQSGVLFKVSFLSSLIGLSSALPSLAYECTIRQYSESAILNGFDGKQREKLLRDVGQALQNLGLSKDAVVAVTLDFDGIVRDTRLVSGSSGDAQIISKVHFDKSFGQLPGVIAPAAITLQFRMNELSQNPFAESTTQFVQTSVVPDYSISIKDSPNQLSIGSISLTQGEPATALSTTKGKLLPYSKSDEAYDNEVFLAMLQTERNYFRMNGRLKSNPTYGPNLLVQAKLLENNHQLDAAAYVYMGAAYNFNLDQSEEQATKALAECLRVSSGCSECNKLRLAVQLISMKRNSFPIKNSFTGFEDTARTILNSFSSKDHRNELARLTLLTTGLPKKPGDTSVPQYDEEILKLTQQLSDEQLSQDVLKSYTQLLNRYAQSKDYTKAKELADEQIRQSSKKPGTLASSLIPAYCARLNLYILNGDIPNVSSALKQIEGASQECRSDSTRQNTFGRNEGATAFAQSAFLAKSKLSADTYKSLEERVKKIAFRLQTASNSNGVSENQLYELTSYLSSVGKAEEALGLIDKAILVHQCVPDVTDNRFQIREMEILTQNPGLKDRNKRLDVLCKKREEDLRSAVVAAQNPASLNRGQQIVSARAALIKYLLEQKRTEEAQKQFKELSDAMENSSFAESNMSNEYRSYYSTLLSFLKPAEGQPALDRKAVLTSLKAVLKKDAYTVAPANFIPRAKSDSNDYGEEVLLIFVADATAKLGETSVAILPVFKNAASFYNSVGNFDAAITYEKKALQIQQQTNAKEADIVSTKSALATFYIGLGQANEADALVREVMQLSPEPGSTLPTLVPNLCALWLEKKDIDKAAQLCELWTEARSAAAAATSASALAAAAADSTRSSRHHGTFILGSSSTPLDLYERVIKAYEENKNFDKAIAFINDLIAERSNDVSERAGQLLRFSLARLYLDKCGELAAGAAERKELLAKSSAAFEDAIKATAETANLKVDWQSNWFGNKRVVQLKQAGETAAAEELEKRL